MLWVAALLSLIIWAIGWASGFLGPRIHLFLLLALLAALAALLPARAPDAAPPDEGDAAPDTPEYARSVPGREGVERGAKSEER
jgi:hypothetical protein